MVMARSTFYITDDLEVTFYGNPQRVDIGIGSYEFWGAKGYDSHWVWELEDAQWDKSLYTPEENKIINQWLTENFKEVSEAIIKNHKKFHV